MLFESTQGVKPEIHSNRAFIESIEKFKFLASLVFGFLFKKIAQGFLIKFLF